MTLWRTFYSCTFISHFKIIMMPDLTLKSLFLISIVWSYETLFYYVFFLLVLKLFLTFYLKTPMPSYYYYIAIDCTPLSELITHQIQTYKLENLLKVQHWPCFHIHCFMSTNYTFDTLQVLLFTFQDMVTINLMTRLEQVVAGCLH